MTAERREHVILATPSREEVVIGAMHVFLRNVATHAEQRVSGVSDPIERVEAYLATRASDMSTLSQDRYEYMMSNDAMRAIYRSAVDASAELLANHLRQAAEEDLFRTVGAVFVARAASLLAEGIRFDDLHRAGARTAASRTALIHVVMVALKTMRWPSSETVLSMMERRMTCGHRNSRAADLT